MPCVIVDASAILAFLLNEPEKNAILKKTAGYELVAPESLPWEIGNDSGAFKKKRLNNALLAHTVIKEFLKIPIKLLYVHLNDAIDICIRKNIYAYDAYMILCADYMQAPILTLDQKLASIAQE